MPADHEQHEGEAAILDKKEQGALDMLLKNHYEPVPPEGYFDVFWASVDEKIEEGIDGARATDAVAGASKAKAATGASKAKAATGASKAKAATGASKAKAA
ncbi:MAG: hypothetical protein KAI47_20160, partial [Deltaproteobacteria bacterium]|nr:hypothetical protein [Deltaproteobacteria bacterium]